MPTVKPKETKGHGLGKLRGEASDAAFEDALLEVPGEADRTALREAYEDLKSKMAKKGKKLVRKLAKKLLKSMLEKMGAGAGRLAGPMFWIWMQAGELGGAIGNWIVNTIRLANNTEAIKRLKLGEDSTRPFDHVNLVDVIIVDKKGKPVAASYTIVVANHNGPATSVTGSTSAAGYDNHQEQQSGKEYPAGVTSVEIDASKINSCVYYTTFFVLRGKTAAQSLVVFQTVVKAVVDVKPNQGGAFYIAPGRGEPGLPGSAGKAYALIEGEEGRGSFELHPPLGVEATTQIPRILPESFFALAKAESGDDDRDFVKLAELNLMLQPFGFGQFGETGARLYLSGDGAGIGPVDPETGYFQLEAKGFLELDVLEDGEVVHADMAIEGFVTEDGIALLDAQTLLEFPARFGTDAPQS